MKTYRIKRRDQRYERVEASGFSCYSGLLIFHDERGENVRAFNREMWDEIEERPAKPENDDE